MAAKQRFCSTKHRVYASRKGVGPNIAEQTGSEDHTDDVSIGAAIRAAEAFTPVSIGDTKTVASIRVERVGADPMSWKVTVPSGSVTAATKIHQALCDHIGDLVALANLLGRPIGEPQLVIRTRAQNPSPGRIRSTESHEHQSAGMAGSHESGFTDCNFDR